MRVLKIVLITAALYILQTVFGGAFGIMGAMPDLLLAFAVIFAIREYDWRAVGIVMFVCAALTGAAAGRSFPLTMLVVCAAAVTAKQSALYLRFIPKYPKTLFLTTTATFVLCLLERMLLLGTFDPRDAFLGTLPRTAYTLAATAVLYPIVGKLLYKPQKKILIQ